MDKCEACRQQGIEADVRGLMKFKDNMEGAEGILEKIWGNINTRITTGLSLVLMAAILTIVGSAFSLLYGSQAETLKQLGEVRVAIQAVETEIKKK